MRTELENTRLCGEMLMVLVLFLMPPINLIFVPFFVLEGLTHGWLVKLIKGFDS